MEPSIQAGTSSIRGRNDTPADRHAPERWERYLPLLIPLLLVSMYMVYIWPLYVELSPLFVMWLILATAALLFAAVRVVSVLRSPTYRSVALDPKGKRATVQKRRFVGVMISAATIAAGYAAIQGITYASTREYEPTGWYTFVLVTASFVFLILFLLLWPGRAAALERLLDTYPGFWLTVLVIAAVLVGSAYATVLKPAQAVEGPPASWADLLGFAHREAAKVDSSAVLQGVSARPDSSMKSPFSPHSTAFLVTFRFRRPDSSTFFVRVFDTDPPGLQSTLRMRGRSSYEANTPLAPSVLPSYHPKLSYVKLSPRDVFRITEQEALNFAQQVAPGQPLEIHTLSLILEDHWQTCFGTTAGWFLTYGVNAGGELRSVRLNIDGASGEIVGREYEPEVPGVKPPAIAGPCG